MIDAGEPAGHADGSDTREAPPGWLTDLARVCAGMEVAPVLRPPAGGGRPAAVLLLFADGPEGPDLLFIQRSHGLRQHPGQPAFPGGAIDDTDAGPAAAALREAAEEAGVDPASVDVLGTLPELFIARSGFRVIPVLAWWRSPAPVSPVDAREVAAVARIRLADLADPTRRLTVRHPSGRTGPAFRVGSMLIWGFTAALVDRLLALGGWELPWNADAVHDLPAEDVEPDRADEVAAGEPRTSEELSTGRAGTLSARREPRPRAGNPHATRTEPAVGSRRRPITLARAR